MRVALDKGGRELARKHQAELTELLQQKSQLPESTYIAKVANASAKARIAMHKYRAKNIDLRRMTVQTLRYRQTRQADKQRKLNAKGSVQAARLSVFEPVVYAQKRLDSKSGVRLLQQSRVLMQLNTAKRAFDRSLPQEPTFQPHVAARRGRNAVTARRLAKRPLATAREEGLIDSGMFEQWLAKQFAVKR